jgi:hypothetical protein
MTASEYAKKLVLEFMRELTDHVFLNIQYNKKLMKDYQTQVNKSGLRAVNQAIGKKVRQIFQLKPDVICSAPRSWLIKDYTTFRRK